MGAGMKGYASLRGTLEMTGDDFRAFVTAEVARWAKVVQDAGVKVE